jgi:hypothetical protein
LAKQLLSETMRKFLQTTRFPLQARRRGLSTKPGPEPLPYSFQRALAPKNEDNEINFHIPLTKIIATIGPASETSAHAHESL